MTQLHIDWGSTNFRVHRIEDGKVVETRSSAEGAANYRSAQEFASVFERATEDWRDRADRIILSGMVTRKGGWVETPYITVPVDLSTLRCESVQHCHGTHRLQFLPGLSQFDPPDVIRGEEATLLGVAEPGVSQLVILPGTHSKWVRLDGFVVRSFRTFMTGEMYALALRKSLAGQLAQGEGEHAEAFADGAAEAQRGTPLASIFQARSRVLVAGAEACGTASYLSGLFIATEILEAMRLHPATMGPPAVVGSDNLVTAYLRAFDLLGVPVAPCTEDAALRGIERLSHAV